MGEYLDLISIDPYHMIITIANLLIMYLLIKKFLFKPVTRILEERKAQVDKIYDDAGRAQEAADKNKAEYTEKLENAQLQAEEIIKKATAKAETKSEEIISEASERANHMIKKAESDIAQEKKKAINDIKNEISDISVSVAQKVIEREIREEDHKNLIDGFIEKL